MYSKILIRYGELTLKGKNRVQFMQVLKRNIKNIIGEDPIMEFDRMFISYSEKNMNNLNYVFGISSYSPILEVANDFEEIKKTALLLVNNEQKTFKVAARRNNKQFEKSSAEINQELGAFILQNSTLKVDVHNPDLTINVEVRAKSTYIFSEFIKGLGGLPVGISGKTLHLMSGGIDSPVAALELMKRGIKVEFLSFITPPQTDEKTINKINNLIKVLTKYQGDSTLYLADYSELMNYIALTSNPSYKITLMRRSFYRIASNLATKLNIKALSNGENLGQVASQTLESIQVIASQAQYPVFRPLLTKDKIETIDIAKKIGTYEISILKANETCELFAPKQPVTKPTLQEAQKLENELDMLLPLEDKLINEYIERIKIQKNNE